MPDHEASLTATRAETKIDQHIDTCEQRYQEWQRQQEHTINYLKDINGKLMELNETISEVRGATKVGKWLIGVISTGSGVVGGLLGHVALK